MTYKHKFTYYLVRQIPESTVNLWWLCQYAVPVLFKISDCFGLCCGDVLRLCNSLNLHYILQVLVFDLIWVTTLSRQVSIPRLRWKLAKHNSKCEKIITVMAVLKQCCIMSNHLFSSLLIVVLYSRAKCDVGKDCPLYYYPYDGFPLLHRST